MSTPNRRSGLDPRLEKLLNRPASKSDEKSGLIAPRSSSELPAETRVLVQLATPQVPPALSKYKLVPLGGEIYAVTVPVKELAALEADPAVLFVEGARRMGSKLDTSVLETGVGRPGMPLDAKGKGVVVGVIDFGFDVRLEDFTDEQGSSRVAFFWDQSLTPTGTEKSPEPYGYGVEYSKTDIQRELASAARGLVVRHQFGPRSHGTHVAGTAAGNGRTGDGQFEAGKFIGVAPESTLILVQPQTLDSDGTFADSVRVAEAIAYVFAKAAELKRPCVINLSLGQNGGSHDGESVVERAIDAMLTFPGRAFVCAAGNEHVMNGHASGDFKEGTLTTLEWKVGGNMPLPGGSTTGTGNDLTPNEMEIWYSHLDEVAVTVRSPEGDEVGPVTVGHSISQRLPNKNDVSISSEQFSRLNGDAQIYVEVAPGGRSSVKSGTWKVILTPKQVRLGHFDAWIERDARRPENNFADQSFFENFHPQMTLGTPATTRRGIAVANYDHRKDVPNDSSSRGPTRDGREKPELAAPGTGIQSSCSGAGQPGIPARTTMTGTSMAAPHVTGVVALLLEKNARLTSAQIASILRASARPHPNGNTFDKAWGFGKLDAVAALARVPQ